jgi:hypothetical protein
MEMDFKCGRTEFEYGPRYPPSPYKALIRVC